MDTFGQFELWDSLKCPDYRGFVIFELRSYCMHHYVTGTDSKALSSLERITGSLLYGDFAVIVT